MFRTRTIAVAAAAAALAAGLAGCAKPGTDGSSGGDGAAPVKVGLVYSKTGPLASYGAQYIAAFNAGLDYATKGTGAVNGHKIQVSEADDAGDPTKAVSAAKTLIGQGATILAGSTASGVAAQLAPIAAQNKTLFISGPAATDSITGVNRYTFRSGRQSYQDILAAQSFIGDAAGKKVTVLAQDNEFGKANVAAVTAVIGAKGATVGSVLAPPTATDLTPFASRVLAGKPDLVFVAWAGATAPALWDALAQQKVLDSTTVVTGLDARASYPTFAKAGGKVSFLSHYVPDGTSNAAADAMKAYLSAHGAQTDLFSPDGFTAAQLIVQAAKDGGSDVDAMIANLEGYSFDGVKGRYTVRKEDHALLQPMFQAKLDGTTPSVTKVLDPAEVAPPVKTMGA